MIVKRFSKNILNIEYPKKKNSWNVAGIIKGQNAFYKFDVRELIKESKNRAYKIGNLDTEADKMVFEFDDRWIILDIKEINKYIEKNKTKDLELSELIFKLEWTIEILK
jgi:hypothetical protein